MHKGNDDIRRMRRCFNEKQVDTWCPVCQQDGDLKPKGWLERKRLLKLLEA